MSYYRRGYNWEQVVYQPAPVGGWNPDVPPHELAANQAQVLDNFIIRPGRISVRGGFFVVQDLSAYYPLNVRGYVVGDTGPPNITTDATTPANVSSNATVGTVLWSNPPFASVYDNFVATCTLDGTNQSDYLQAYGFGFEIPAGATINGITATINRAGTPGVGGTIQDYIVTLVKAASPVGANRAIGGVPWPAPLAWQTYGGTSDLWGTTWSAADINNPQFGIALSVNGNETAAVNSITLAITYTPSGGATISTSQWGLLGCKAVVPSLTVDHWHVPWVRPTAAASLGKGTGTGVWLTIASNTTLASLNPTPGCRWINFDGLLYGISYDDLGTNATANDTNSNYLIWRTKLCTLSLSELAPTVPTPLPLAPQGALDLKNYQSRVWLLGGIDIPGGATTHSATTLFFTNPGASGVGSATSDWQDPVTGLTNIIRMDNNSHDFGVGLATISNSMLIFRKKSIYALKGSTTANYDLVLLSREVGSLDARSIVETDQGVYFLDDQGFMLVTNATSPAVKNMSGSVLITLQNALAQFTNSVLTGDGGYATCALAADGKILVSIGSHQTVAGLPTGRNEPIWCGLYDRSSGAWTRVTSQLWENDGSQAGTNWYPGPVVSRVTPDIVYAIGDRYVTDVNGIMRSAPPSLYDQLPSGESPFLPIPAVWKTGPIVRIGDTTLTRKLGQAKRFFCDYVFAAPGMIPATGFSVTPVDPTDTPYANNTVLNVTPSGLMFADSSISLPNGICAASANPWVQRQNLDWPNETTDVGFDVVWTDVPQASNPDPVRAEMYGVGVEYQPARDAR